jgi:predicted AAA+ superfamily ATPase
MSYIKRHIEAAITNPLYQKGAIAVTGARQTGKSTMLSHLLGDIKCVTLDDIRERELAVNSPDEFIKDLGTPVFIDEIQRAPDLLSYIKMTVDSRKEDGLYYLSGSQKFNMMKNMSEILRYGSRGASFKMGNKRCSEKRCYVRGVFRKLCHYGSPEKLL